MNRVGLYFVHKKQVSAYLHKIAISFKKYNAKAAQGDERRRVKSSMIKIRFVSKSLHQEDQTIPILPFCYLHIPFQNVLQSQVF